MAVSDISAASIDASNAQQRIASQKSGQSTQQALSLQTITSSSSTQLSTFGKTKLSLEGLQAKAQALQNFNNSPNFNDLKVAVLGFVQAFNTVHTDVTKSNSTASDSRSTSALSATSNSVTDTNKESTRTSLEKIGITLQKDGTLSVNQARLEKAFREDQPKTANTLAELGLRVEQTTGQRLTVKSDVTVGAGANNTGTGVSDTGRVNEADQQQKTEQRRQDTQKNDHKAQVAQQASLAPASAAASSGPAVNAVATYIGVSTL